MRRGHSGIRGAPGSRWVGAAKSAAPTDARLMYTQRELASALGCSESAVVKAIRAGRLDATMSQSRVPGRASIVDLDLAKALMSVNGHLDGSGTKLGHKLIKPDENATEAILRKETAILIAQERALLEERGGLVEARVMVPWVHKLITTMSDALMSHIETIAALAGGQEPQTAVRRIREGVIRAMAAAQAVPRPHVPKADSPRHSVPLPPPGSPSEELTRVRVRRHQVSAAAAEMKNAIQAGELIRADAFIAQIQDRLLAGRSVLMNTYSGVLSTLTVGEVRSLLQRRFQEAVATWRGQEAITFPEQPAPKPPPPKRERLVIPKTLAALTAEFNDMVPQATALGISWARIHSSQFGDKLGAVTQINKLRAAISEREGAAAD